MSLRRKMKPGSTSSSSSSANNSRAASPSSSSNSRMESDGKSDLVHDFILAATGARNDAENPLKNLILKQQASLKENGSGNHGMDEGENSREASIFNGGEDERSNEASTMTEPDKLGPCEPGTAVRLQGIVWQETEKGLLVLNVTWKGKTYMGTLLDCNRQSEAHKWGPLSDPSAIKGRGSKRNRSARSRTPPVSSNGGSKHQKKNGRGPLSSAPKTPEPNPFPASHIPSKVKRKAALNALCGLKKKDPEDDEDSGDDFDDDENDLRDCLIECPKSNCSKKFRDLEALKFHLSFAHNDLRRPKKPMETKVPDKDAMDEDENASSSSHPLTVEGQDPSEAKQPEKQEENGCHPMPLNTLVSLPQEPRHTTSSTGSSSNKDSCESNAYSDISDEEPEGSSVGGDHKPPPQPVPPQSSSQNPPRTSSDNNNVPTQAHSGATTAVPPSPLPTSSSMVQSPGPSEQHRLNHNNSVPSSHPLNPQAGSSPKASSSSGLGVPSTPPPFSSQAFRHFAMFGSSSAHNSLGGKTPLLGGEHHHPLFSSNHPHHQPSRKIPSQLDSSKDILRFPHHIFNPPPDFNNPFLAASKLQELQEKAFSNSLHPEHSPSSPSSGGAVGPSLGPPPGSFSPLMGKRPPNGGGPNHLHNNLFPRGVVPMHLNNHHPLSHHNHHILRHEHKHTHLHLPGISPLSPSNAKGGEAMDTTSSNSSSSHFSPGGGNKS